MNRTTNRGLIRPSNTTPWQDEIVKAILINSPSTKLVSTTRNRRWNLYTRTINRKGLASGVVRWSRIISYVSFGRIPKYRRDGFGYSFVLLLSLLTASTAYAGVVTIPRVTGFQADRVTIAPNGISFSWAPSSGVFTSKEEAISWMQSYYPLPLYRLTEFTYSGHIYTFHAHQTPVQIAPFSLTNTGIYVLPTRRE